MAVDERDEGAIGRHLVRRLHGIHLLPAEVVVGWRRGHCRIAEPPHDAPRVRIDADYNLRNYARAQTGAERAVHGHDEPIEAGREQPLEAAPAVEARPRRHHDGGVAVANGLA